MKAMKSNRMFTIKNIKPNTYSIMYVYYMLEQGKVFPLDIYSNTSSYDSSKCKNYTISTFFSNEFTQVIVTSY